MFEAPTAGMDEKAVKNSRDKKYISELLKRNARQSLELWKVHYQPCGCLSLCTIPELELQKKNKAVEVMSAEAIRVN